MESSALNRRASRKKKAFTLLEVMVAVAILAVAAMFISRGIATALRMQRIIRESVKTAWACEAALARLAVSGQFNVTGVQNATADTKFISVTGEALTNATDPQRIVTMDLIHPPDPTIKVGPAGKEVYPLKVNARDFAQPPCIGIEWVVHLKKAP